jgi:heat shock protein HtpX
MAEKISFHDQIARNKRNSVFLVIIVFVVLIVLGYAISFAFSPEYFFLIMVLASIISLVYVLTTYYNSDKIAIASVKAKKADPVAHRDLYHAVENMAIASGMPKPQVYVMPGKQINAFATGRDPQHGVVCVTEGALERLNKQELEAVVGHEMSHIANYDIRFVTTVAIVVGAISIFSYLFIRSLWFGGGRGGSRRSGGGGEGNAIFFLIAIAIAILAPIIVKLVQLAISRRREFAADAGSVQFTRYPPGMVNALKKIKKDSESLKVPGAVAPMFLSDTSKKRLSNLFMTHPPIDKRIEVLERM